MDKALFNRLRVGDKIRKDGLKGSFTVIDNFDCGRKIEIIRCKKIEDSNTCKWHNLKGGEIALSSLTKGNILKHKSSGLEYIVELVAADHVSCVHMTEIHEEEAKKWHLYVPDNPDD